MTDRFEIQKRLVEQAMGVDLESTRPVHMSIDDAMKALWPLNKVFRDHVAPIQSLTYDKAQEAAADAAVERMVMDGADWSAEPPGVWRVLLERQMQVLQLLAIKAAEAGSWSAPFVPVPEPANAALRAKLAMVFLLHSTPLPFPIVERSGAELPRGDVPGSLTRH